MICRCKKCGEILTHLDVKMNENLGRQVKNSICRNCEFPNSLCETMEEYSFLNYLVMLKKVLLLFFSMFVIWACCEAQGWEPYGFYSERLLASILTYYSTLPVWFLTAYFHANAFLLQLGGAKGIAWGLMFALLLIHIVTSIRNKGEWHIRYWGPAILLIVTSIPQGAQCLSFVYFLLVCFLCYTLVSSYLELVDPYLERKFLDFIMFIFSPFVAIIIFVWHTLSFIYHALEIRACSTIQQRAAYNKARKHLLKVGAFEKFEGAQIPYQWSEEYKNEELRIRKVYQEEGRAVILENLAPLQKKFDAPKKGAKYNYFNEYCFYLTEEGEVLGFAKTEYVTDGRNWEEDFEKLDIEISNNDVLNIKCFFDNDDKDMFLY